ncbi:MAG: class I SAM-dependent methyltransferase [Planctomycetes bacterium]|nr:class I SAM-dependent methyltransferase [Planctomycetota bacterium]
MLPAPDALPAAAPSASPGAAPLETLTACPLCGAAESRAWVEGFDRLHRIDARRFTYRRCASCRLVYLSPRPTAQAIGAYYPHDYGPYQIAAAAAAAAAGTAAASAAATAAAAPSAPAAPLDPKRSWPRAGPTLRRLGLPAARALNGALRLLLRDRADRELKHFYKPSRPGLKLMDFGCGSEKWLNHAKKLGYAAAVGVDFSPQVIERVRAAGHEGHVNGPGLWEAIAPGSLDLIRLNHVLEHLYEPQQVLTRLIERLAPGGRLHLALPNPDSLSARWFKSRWFSLDCPRHVMLFSPQRTRQFIEALGLRDVTLLHETVTKDIARSIGYGCIDRGELPADRVEALMHDELLAELAWLPARVAALLGRADRFHLLARKEGA